MTFRYSSFIPVYLKLFIDYIHHPHFLSFIASMFQSLSGKKFYHCLIFSRLQHMSESSGVFSTQMISSGIPRQDLTTQPNMTVLTQKYHKVPWDESLVP